MRLAGTWIRYSNSAMPHETSAATIHGFSRRSRRCAYQAKVMKTFEQTSRSAVRTIRFIRFGVPIATATGNGLEGMKVTRRTRSDDAERGMAPPDRRPPGSRMPRIVALPDGRSPGGTIPVRSLRALRDTLPRNPRGLQAPEGLDVRASPSAAVARLRCDERHDQLGPVRGRFARVVVAGVRGRRLEW